MRMNGLTWPAAAATSVVLLAAGCGSTTEDAGTTTPATTAAATTKAASATEQLTAAAAKTSAAAYTYKAADPSVEGSIEGAIDPAAATATGKLSVGLDASTKISVETLLVAGGYYVKIGGLPIPGIDGSKWFKYDPAKVSADNALGLGDAKDPVQLSAMPASIAGAQSTDGKSFTGTLDLTKKAWGPFNDPELITGLGDKAKAVPFTATVDAEGHLAALKVSLPAYADTPASDTEVTFAGFGQPVTATAPAAADVMEAPAALYDVLNNK
ncbi:hypothetical protein ACQP2P_29635 [Dactylosporangium sp. CA-139114]|uniref:hypothetical protein n=1 Tax=Dactylosporangium sp. CA-139114 TaxID=3239931 RepID=UPI003D99A61F